MPGPLAKANWRGGKGTQVSKDVKINSNFVLFWQKLKNLAKYAKEFWEKACS